MNEKQREKHLPVILSKLKSAPEALSDDILSNISLLEQVFTGAVTIGDTESPLQKLYTPEEEALLDQLTHEPSADPTAAVHENSVEAVAADASEHSSEHLYAETAAATEEV